MSSRTGGGISAIDRRQIWLSNFSLKPLALECRTLTKDTLVQGADWSFVGSSHEHVGLGQWDTTKEALRVLRDADTYTAEVCELYSACLAKALFEKGLIQRSRSTESRDSELYRKMTRADQRENVHGSAKDRDRLSLVGRMDEPMPPKRVPARLWKAPEEPTPLPQALPTADRFSWDGTGLDPNAESEDARARRKASIHKEGIAAALLLEKRAQDKNWSEVKADLSVYAYSGGVVATDPRREQSYVDSVLLGLGLGPRKPGEPIPEKFKHLSEYDIAALTEVNARKAAVYWVEGTPRTTVRFMKHDTIPTGPPIKVPPHNLKGEAAQWVDDALEAEHKRGLPSNPPRDNMHGREWRSDDSGDGPALCKALFFEAWPLIS